uniref:Uncharacterized protein n=1 Tax=Oryctolagus cuniculus TaxID=9986 RepID=A0A5F9C1Y4_RABIT
MLQRTRSELKTPQGLDSHQSSGREEVAHIRHRTRESGHLGSPRLRPTSTPPALLTDRIHAVREEQSAGAAPSGGGGCLGPSMSSADDYHVEVRSPGVLFGEGSRYPAATATEGEHSGSKLETNLEPDMSEWPSVYTREKPQGAAILSDVTA